jgi:DNA adenine methylase
VHQRLGDVVIENLDWADLLPRYDRPETLFYLDPPYWGSEGDYGPGLFARADFEQLAAALGKLDGKFLLSINDTPEIRALFAWAEIAEVRTTYTISRKDRSAEVPELLIGKGVELNAVDPQVRLL